MSLDRGRGWKRVAVTFRDQPEPERRDNEYDYSSFCVSEAKPLPHFIEFETPAFFNHEVTSAASSAVSFAAAEPKPNDSVS